MSKLLIFILTITTTFASENPIYDQILKNKPSINKHYAMKLSNAIHKVSIKYNIPKRIFTAILMQESNYKLKIVATKTGLRKLSEIEKNHYIEGCANVWLSDNYSHYIECVKELETARIKDTVETDYGITQIYWKNVEKLKLDVDKLLKDMQYSIVQGAKILSGFKKQYAKDDPDWYTRYNCGSRGTTKRRTCQEYKRRINRYL